MLNFLGPKSQFCDGISRRSFLHVGGSALGGLTLPQLLQAEQQSGRRSHKAVIVVYLSGGLAHQDSFDLKPEAPPEVRGEFKPIDTTVPGLQVSELLPKLAHAAQHYSLIRSIVGLADEHTSFQNLTGFGMNQSQREGKPNFGSVVAKLQGSVDGITPPFIDLFPIMQHKPYNVPGPGIMGRPFAGVKVDGEDIAVMKLKEMTQVELNDRRQLMDKIDAVRRQLDNTDMTGLDTNYRRAFDVLTSSKLVDALNVEKEPIAVRERYGKGSPRHQGDGAPQWNDQLLMARRLVEAGARVVTVAYGFWDTHGQNFKSLRRQLPVFDAGISALVEDIYARGLDRDVTVVVWGEFGRTPKINKDAGRDHWSRVNSCLIAGGGMRVGQVIGSTDSTAAAAKNQPIHYRNVLATMYRALGLDPHGFVTDMAGRPGMTLPHDAEPIAQLF